MTTLGNGSKARTPSGMKVAPMSYAKLEQVADDLRPLLPVESRRGSKCAIDAWRVLEKVLPQAGFSYVVADTHELSDCAAFTVPEQKIVVLREDVYDGLFTDSAFSRSTVVHELAHIVLNHSVTLHRGAVLGAHKFFEDSEWQAKALTAAVMMPIAVCKKASSASHLAALCGTSDEAAGYRLKRLINDGLIPKEVGMGALF